MTTPEQPPTYPVPFKPHATTTYGGGTFIVPPMDQAPDAIGFVATSEIPALPAGATAVAELPAGEGIAPVDDPNITSEATPHIRFRRTRRIGGAMLVAGGLVCAAYTGIHGTAAVKEYRVAASDRRIAAENAYDQSPGQQAINADLRDMADKHQDRAGKLAFPLLATVPGSFTGAIMGTRVILWNRKPKANTHDTKATSADTAAN